MSRYFSWALLGIGVLTLSTVSCSSDTKSNIPNPQPVSGKKDPLEDAKRSKVLKLEAVKAPPPPRK
jgi:hypothetical protein